jgi:hypothetical protein
VSKETPADENGPAIVRRFAPRPPEGAAVRPISDIELLAAIGRELRSVYAELLREPLPEHLAVIIERLETRKPDRH